MKAICIDATTGRNEDFKLIEGDVYSVEQDRLFQDHYWLPELDQGYLKFRFIPLSNIDETELVNQQQRSH